jgi:formylglycine-generating enzyme required for sulfatase activity
VRFSLRALVAIALLSGAASAERVRPTLPSPPVEQGTTGGVVVLSSPRSSMVLLRGGEFTMGSPPNEVIEAGLLCAREHSADLCSLPLGRESAFNRHTPIGLEGVFANELMAHPVSLSPFWIDRREVTVAEYRRCVEVGACADPKLAEGAARFDAPELPMTHVTWTEASNYCAWRGARLPTEAEWERAARGTASRRFPWGDLYNRRVANHGGLEATFFQLDGDLARTRVSTLVPEGRDGAVSLAPVGSFPDGRTPDGIDDLAGNVAEWVADWFSTRYPEASLHDPKGPTEGTFRIVRGGSWLHPAPYLRGAARMVADGGERNGWIGFRCVSDG